jgi:hypothetical protein
VGGGFDEGVDGCGEGCPGGGVRRTEHGEKTFCLGSNFCLGLLYLMKIWMWVALDSMRPVPESSGGRSLWPH